MTRVNVIKPEDLTNEWLVAEFRELPRIINELEKHPNRFKAKDIPEQYTLGNGHVKFFRDKLVYLAKRHREIRKELKRRGIKVNKKIKVELYYLHDSIKSQCLNDWTPTSRDHDINIERLQERFDLRKRAYHLTSNGVKRKIDCEHTFNQYCERNLSKYY